MTLNSSKKLIHIFTMPKQTPERQRKPNAFAGLTPLQAPVPPMLAKAIGYTGDARFVSFHWTPYGDEVDYSDGRMSATGNWHPFLTYIQHPAVSPHLGDYDFGSSDSEATHALILDRKNQTLYVAPVKEAAAFLTKQRLPWPPIRMSQEEYLAKISEALKQVKQPKGYRH